MNFHKLLKKQISKYLPEALQQHPDMDKFLKVINDSYGAYERDKELSERAFSISEEEYLEINKRLKHEAEVKQLSIKKLNEAIGTITGEEKSNNIDDLLMIARYLNQQVNKRKNAELVFSSLIANMESAILLEDETRHIVFTNQRFCDMFCLPIRPEQLQGIDFRSSAEETKHLFKHPESYVKNIAGILEKKELVNAEIIELADGRIFERDYIPIFLDQKFKGNLWNYTDITEKKKAQIAIEKSELTNRLIMNAALDAIVIINEHGKITFWNPQAEKIFGWKENEVKDKSLSETIIPERFRKGHEMGMAHYHRTGQGPVLKKIIEIEAVNKEGYEFPVELSIIDVKQDGNVFFCGFIRDISERKKAEEDLKASQELWQFALEGAGDGVWQYDFETEDIFFSKQYKKMLGYEDNEFQNRPEEWISRVFEDDLKIIEETNKQYFSGEITSHQREYRIRHKKGNYLWVLDRGMVVNYSGNGKPNRIIGTYTDITARKKAEEEYKHISVVASANENGVIFTNAEGKIIWNNEGFERLTGFSKDEMTGKTPIELCKGPLSNQDILSNMVNAFFEGRSFNIEVIHYRKDNSCFWGRVTGQPTMDSNGKVVQYFAIIEDISLEKEQEQQILSLAENVPGVLYRYEYNQDGSEAFTYISPDAEKKIGIPESHLMNFYGIIYPDDIEREKEISRLTRILKTPYHFEGRFQVPGKPIVWLKISSSHTHTTKVGTTVHMGIIVNTTKEKEAEIALQKNEAKYRSIIANMNLGLIEVDRDDNIQFINQSFCEMSGYSAEELIGKNASGLFVKGENHNFVENKNDLRKQGISDAYEVSVKNKRGEIKWWLISGAPRFDDNGEFLGSIGIHLDITEHKQLELELIRAREQAESSANAKQTFLANMSHEIRTPMNAILGMINRLAKTKMDENQQFYLKTVHSAADNLLVIINDILDLSKIDAAKLSLEKVGFEPQTVISRVMQVMMHRAEEKGLNFTNSFLDSKLSPVLLGDPYRLNQVLLNLVSNAIKFTQKGSVDISLKVLSENNKKQVVQFKVIDTGIGMDQEFTKNLFQKFQQEDNSILRKYGGTGLGMSISKELIELMHGKIDVKSKKSYGTTISVTITFEKGQLSDLPYKETKAINTNIFKGIKILVADDNAMNRLVASTILNDHHVKITEVANGAEAIEKVKEMPFDIILMDVNMPVMDGLAATKIIRHSFTKEQLPIIALTAFAMSGDNTKCIEAGMNDYLSKPFDETQLLNMISRWLDKNDGAIALHPQEKAAPLYDLTKLKQIAKGNESFITKMISLFVEQATVSVQEIIVAFEAKDLQKVNKIAHRLRPSIEDMGIASLKNCILEIEKMALENKHSDDLSHRIILLDSTIKHVIEELKTEAVEV